LLATDGPTEPLDATGGTFRFIGVRARVLQPPKSGKAIIFRANAKNEKNCTYYTKKAEFIPSSEMKCPKSAIFITWWGESGKTILQVSIAVFFSGAVEIFFPAKMAQSQLTLH